MALLAMGHKMTQACAAVFIKNPKNDHSYLLNVKQGIASERPY